MYNFQFSDLKWKNWKIYILQRSTEFDNKMEFEDTSEAANIEATPMDIISGMATMALAILTISFCHRSGHFWP